MLNEDDERYTGVRAMPTLAMAILEQCGICDMIDERIEPDPQRILTPGKAVKLMVGAMFMGMGRRPLYLFDRLYASAPLELLCGDGVVPKNLNARAFSRALDDIFALDLPALTFDIYSRLAERYLIAGFVYHIDSTNFGVTAVVIDRDDPEAAIPEWNGHAKDGDNSKRVYNLQTVTDRFGIVCYERPYDGTVSDSDMDGDTIDFLCDRIDPKTATFVADSKIVTAELIAKMTGNGVAFVSKCPKNFGDKVREGIVYSVEHSEMDPSGHAAGWEIYDCDAEVDGRTLRFVAYRVPGDKVRNIEYYRTEGLKKVESKMRPLVKRHFACQEDALIAFAEAEESLEDTGYIVTANAVTELVRDPYGKRGRPPTGWTPTYHNEYRLDIECRFSERLAEELSSDREIRVLITNLPRSQRTMDNPRDGATADDVLRIYLGQYRIEHSFRTSKSEFNVDTVYFHRPSRANAFMFVVSLATMTAGIINAAMRRQGRLKTAEGMIDDLAMTIVKHDRLMGTEWLMGDEISTKEFRQYIQVMDLDKDNLFSN